MSDQNIYAEQATTPVIPSLRLTPDKTVSHLLFLFSLAMMTFGVQLVRIGEPGGWLLLVLFGVSCCATLSVIFPGACYLEIDTQGVTHASCFRKKTYTWDQIDRLGLIELGMVRRVGIDLNSRYLGPERVPNVLKPSSGYHVSLPVMAGMELDAQLELMEKCQQAARLSAANSVPRA